MFNADLITLDNFEGIFKCHKKPIIVHALQLNLPEGFEVTTMEGKLKGKPRDYLMFGVNGEKYPCDKEIFEKTYDAGKEWSWASVDEAGLVGVIMRCDCLSTVEDKQEDSCGWQAAIDPVKLAQAILKYLRGKVNDLERN